jgi:hypothetical protein
VKNVVILATLLALTSATAEAQPAPYGSGGVYGPGTSNQAGDLARNNVTRKIRPRDGGLGRSPFAPARRTQRAGGINDYPNVGSHTGTGAAPPDAMRGDEQPERSSEGAVAGDRVDSRSGSSRPD